MLASMLAQILISSLVCHNDTIYNGWLKSVIEFKRYHAKHTFGSKFEITKGCSDLEKGQGLKNLNNTMFAPKQCSYASLVKIHQLVHKIELRKD